MKEINNYTWRYKRYKIISRTFRKVRKRTVYIIFNEKAFHSRTLDWQLGSFGSLEDAKRWIDENKIKYDWKVIFWRVYQIQHYWRLRHVKVYYFK